MRTLREMQIGTVAVFSDTDRTSLHVRMADEAERVGPAPSSESHLHIDRIIPAAREHSAGPSIRHARRESVVAVWRVF